jgi:hypothetical protein
MKPNLYAAAVIALSSAFFLSAPAQAQVDFSLVIGNAPPPPRFESVPQPRPGYVWAPGYWNWDGHSHAWSAGHWEPERRGYRYERPEWQRDNDGWRLNRGGWIQAQSGNYVETSNVTYVRVAPPPPRREWTPRPRPGYVWAAGHWEWQGRDYQWVPGVWIAERPGYDYVVANWARRDGRWYLEPGRWSPRAGYDHERRHDRDHDGYGDPGRRDRDHDGVPNRYDRDRDGDGVPNRFDSNPDNSRRN